VFAFHNPVVQIYHLSDALKMSYELPGNAKVWDDHIDQARQVLDSRPVGHPGRALATGYLADSLKTCYQRTSDLDLLNEAISLERETLDLCSKGDPARATSCRHLAESLRMCYQRIGDSHLLTEAVDLAREALNLCSDDHLDWALLCVGLSISLQMSYQRNGHLLLLNEAIDLAREALAVCPYEHLHRAVSCENLASALILRYEHTGESSLPMEAIDLAREAYDLSHPKDSHYAMYCISLSHSLKMLHKLTDDDDLVLEAIELGRQAMVVVHSGHLDRAACCEDLSDSLVLRYKQTNDNILLEEAIDLARESLALRSEGHTDRAMSCGQLADSLRIRLQRTGDGQTLDDAMILAREALALRPEGYPDHAMFCRYLAGLLSVQQKLTKDETIIGEIFSLSKDALAHAPPHTAWVHACSLAWVHLQTISPFYDLNQAIFYLGQSLDHEFDHPSIAVAAVLTGLEDLWDHNLEEKHVALTVVYERLVKRISLLIHPALHSRPQLQKLTKWTYIGSDAFVSGALGNSWISSFETLELAEDITWQQRLHRRDVQIHHVPGPMGMRLGMLLTAIATQDELHTSQDELYRRVAMSSRAHALVKEIQTIIPGLHRFMLGETYEDLRAVASSHPVVVLVGARNRYYALIMSSSEPDGHKLLPLDINNDGVEFPPILSSSARSQSGISGTLEFGIESRTSGVTSLNDQLASLWRKIVKPVLAHLGLAVSTSFLVGNNLC
jgi:tetratricopeptide (TPR) repeat protein